MMKHQLTQSGGAADTLPQKYQKVTQLLRQMVAITDDDTTDVNACTLGGDDSGL